MNQTKFYKISALGLGILLFIILSSQGYAQCHSTGHDNMTSHSNNMQMPEGIRAADTTKLNKTDTHQAASEKNMNHTDMKNCGMMNHSDAKMKSDSTESSLDIPIDVDKIDMNKDGMVFQDQMDWDVITDAAGDCPKCGMKLKKVSLKVAKDNLIENGFKVKQ